MSNYSLNLPEGLRRAYEHLAVDAGPTVKLKDKIIQGLRLALPILEAEKAGTPFLRDADDLVTALRGGHMTQLEGLAAVELLTRRVGLSVLGDWTKETNRD